MVGRSRGTISPAITTIPMKYQPVRQGKKPLLRRDQCSYGTLYRRRIGELCVNKAVPPSALPGFHCPSEDHSGEIASFLLFIGLLLWLVRREFHLLL
jgi:hypothetical protein